MDFDLLFATPNFIVEQLKRNQARKWCPILSGRVVDIGCGFSPYRRFLTSATEYVGVETEARYRPSIVAVASDLPFENGTVDGAMLTEVLEHLPEPEAALREAGRVLRPGGTLYVTVPMTWGLHYVPHDYYRFTRFGIAYLLEKVGFEVVSIEPMGGLFSIISARLVEAASTTLLARPLDRLGVRRGKTRLTALPFVPFNAVAYPLGRIFDRLWTDDVFGWAVVARKPDAPSPTRVQTQMDVSP